MNWIEGYSASYYLTLVDPRTWRDIGTVDITGGRVTRTTKNLMESADIALTENLGERWVRIWNDATQGDSGDRDAIFTGLLQTPGVSWEGRRGTYSAECYSVLKPADDVLLPRGWYVMSGTNGAKAAADLLSVGPAPVTYEDSAPLLASTIVAENGETNLSMAWKIITAIGWRIRINGHGDINVCPMASDPAIRLDTQLVDIVEPVISDTMDLYSVPNVFRATSGDLTAVVKDEASIEQRGREIWAADDNCHLNTGETIRSYAARRLAQLQSPSRIVKYQRRYMPNVTAGDIANLTFPEQQIFGDYRIMKQNITLGYAATIAEEVEHLV